MHRLRKWLLAMLLGKTAYTLQPLPVQAGDFIVLTALKPQQTGNVDQRVKVLNIAVRFCVQVQYEAGFRSSYVLSPEDLLLAKESAQ